MLLEDSGEAGTMKALKIGEKAPQFAAKACYDNQIVDIRSEDFLGKWVLLFFYPKDYSYVCPTELRMLAKHQAEFEEEGAQVLAISVDTAVSHCAWMAAELPEIRYPLLADPDKTIARAYGVLDRKEGVALRGAFIINPEGIVQYCVISNMNVGRSVEELLRVLAALKTGGLCGAGWKKGDKPLPVREE